MEVIMGLLYYIDPRKTSRKRIVELLDENEAIKFVSLVAVDLGNNHTDEKIPVSVIKDDIDGFIKNGMQTDGSSVNLPIIATINNAKVDLIPDDQVKWIVDYNYAHDDGPIGTLIIPSYLHHDDTPVCSRSILKLAINNFETQMKELINQSSSLKDELGIEASDAVKSINITTAMELEFWVKTPNTNSDYEKLSTSQQLKEQYWKRTVGNVRSALEESLLLLEKYAFEPEMGHKEVGGVAPKLNGHSLYSHVMEQLEVDWKYADAMQSADHELFAKDIIKDVYERFGLDISFLAKPIEGVAGSGEHHHVGASATLESGRTINLYAPTKMTDAFVNRIGYGAMMGILRHYEVINPFVSSTNDSLNRLKPGFEAPVCIVSSLGHSPAQPSRNRTVLLGLIRDMENPFATRFELRSPNPNSNSYLVLAALYQAKLDGIKAVIQSGQSLDEIAKGFDKKAGEEHFYLETSRCYRSEEDVFEDFTDEERDQLFGAPPKTVFENLSAFDTHKAGIDMLKADNVFTSATLASYRESTRIDWELELSQRIIFKHMKAIRQFVPLHTDEVASDLDVVNWEAIHAKRLMLMKSRLNAPSVFDQIRHAISEKDFKTASDLQVYMNKEMTDLTINYINYKHNLLSI